MSVDSNLRELFGVDERPEAFDQVSITVASPEIIRSWSKGEVKNPETINYRTFKPEKGGLFCERIFGPTRDWECACGKYKRIKHKGVICDRCGVEVTLSRVRRERMGHIELAVPVSHIWFYKCMPSRIGLLLDITARQLERVIYYEDFIVTEPGNTGLAAGQLLTEVELRDAEDAYGDGSFRAAMGAEALQELLKQVDLPELIKQLEIELAATKSKQNRKKLAKRLKIAQGFNASRSRPEWMVQTVLPVIPPDLRPLVPLEGGRFATSDLNDLYRRVINRNNRLKNLLQLKTPEVIIRNEKRMLQEAVDALFDNGRHGRAVTGAGNRPLKSLSDMLKGKGGRFRQNLLGKRVDYSGRSVIVVGPDLRLNQCGLPKKMALTLFEPFIIRRLKELGYCHTVRSAKKMIDRKTTEVWDILAEVTKGHPILLNRAPTLHRLSIQAFEPKLIEGEAIRVHPLVCTAYNADFDGDQMAVHVPLSVEAQMEARMLMLAPNNIFSPASGRPITVPSQDIILGTYYLTWAPVRTQKDREKQEHLPLFENASEVEFAIASRKIEYHCWIRFRNPDFGRDTLLGDKDNKVIETTPGRVRFNEIWPEGLGFVNYNVGKKQIGEIIWKCYQVAGQAKTVETLDNLKTLGFKEATRSGTSIGIVDMVIPEEKKEIIADAYEKVEKVTTHYRRGVITDGERYQKVVDVWTHATDTIASALYRKIEHNEGKAKASPLFMMVDSGARGNKSQIKQLGGMRGLMAKPSGEIIERPIISNFREGLSVLEYFISTHGARKGLSDTALKTADSGYMTRKLVDVAQDVIITHQDCGTANGIYVSAIMDGDEEAASLATRIYGRSSCEQIKDPDTGEIIIEIDDVINERQAAALERIGAERLKIRSVLTCESDHGCCANCYGLNLATSKPVKIGESVGIIAAQSIGEPGTQLTMRTFHVGGVAAATFKQPVIKVKHSGQLVYKSLRTAQDAEGHWVVLNKNGMISIRDADGLELESQNIIIGSVISVKDGEQVAKGDTIVTWDPYNVPILTEWPGVVRFRDMISGITVANETDKATGKKGVVITEHKEDLHPQVVIELRDKVEIKKGFDELTPEIRARLNKESGLEYLKPGVYPRHIVVKQNQVRKDIGYPHRIPSKDLPNDQVEVYTSNQTVKSDIDTQVRNWELRQVERMLGEHGLRIFAAGQFFDPKKLKEENAKRARLGFAVAESTPATIKYSIPVGAHLSVNEGDVIGAGTQIAKTPRKVARTKDITGGLPRVAELFEARKPKDSCVIAKIDGEVSFGSNVRGKKRVIVTHSECRINKKNFALFVSHMPRGLFNEVIHKLSERYAENEKSQKAKGRPVEDRMYHTVYSADPRTGIVEVCRVPDQRPRRSDMWTLLQNSVRDVQDSLAKFLPKEKPEAIDFERYQKCFSVVDDPVRLRDIQDVLDDMQGIPDVRDDVAKTFELLRQLPKEDERRNEFTSTLFLHKYETTEDHLVPMGKHIVVTDGDRVKRGDQITEGPVSPEDLLEACGAQELQEHLVNEVQAVYRVQGVDINDKHIEVIVRQMLRKVKITDPGDADQYLWGDQVDRSVFKRVNAEIIANGGKPAEGEPVLLGITKASLETDSFISAASFQDTTRVLTEAATLGKVDYLKGFKENVIMGHLIPAGTGFDVHRERSFEFTVEEPEPIIIPKEIFSEEEEDPLDD